MRERPHTPKSDIDRDMKNVPMAILKDSPNRIMVRGECRKSRTYNEAQRA